MTIDDLTHQIEETERLIAVYRNANDWRPDRRYPRAPACGDGVELDKLGVE